MQIYNSPIITEEFLKKYKGKQPNWGYNGLGLIVYKRCVDIDTPVLCADLNWKKAGSLKEGEKIIGFDEFPVNASSKNKTRYLRIGEVTHNKIEEAECMGIELEDGTILYSTPEHSWLVKFKDNSMNYWRDTKDLEKTQKNNKIYLLRLFGKPWSPDKSFEGGYLSGVFDGEASLDNTCGIHFCQVQNSVLETTEKYLKNLDFSFKKSIKSGSTSYKYKNIRQTCYSLRTYGVKNVFRFLGIIRPTRLLNKYMTNLDSFTKYSKFGKEFRCNPEDYVEVKRVFKAGKRKIAVLSTNIKTHFTGGFASHNTYSRLKNDNTYEDWYETVARCINGAQEIGADYTKEEAERLYDYIFNLKCSFAGRMLWMLGTDHIKRWGANALINCFGMTITEYEDFCFLFENLMLGGGVGFSVRREDIHELPKVKENIKVTHKNTNDADFIVPDSREGWVYLLRQVLKSYFRSGKSFSYSTILVRGYGEKINGLGGTASGPKILVEGIENICKVISAREGKKLRSIDALDICNIIASIVVSGNIRRSATISIGDPDDYLYIRAKRWDLGDIPNWRALSNNTIYADDFSHIQPDIWEGYIGNGEPYGFFNIKLAQKVGRIRELRKDNCELLNPCGEITLANKEICCLSELYLNNIVSKKELIDCAKLLYKTQKAICAMNFLHEDTNKIVHKNMRIGIGITGVCQSLDKLEWLDECYKEVREFDKEWSKKKEYPESIKITTIKPSGTLSLLAGSTPGVHPAYSQYYIRRIRMSSDDKLVVTCKELGYTVEAERNFDDTINYKTVIVEFPCYAGDNVIVAKDMTAVKQLELVKQLMTLWADNSISVTVYYKKEELPEIKKWLKDHYKDSIKSVSFLLHKEHGFKQAPYEEITKEQYEERIVKVKLLKDITVEKEHIDFEECKGGVCPIK